MSANAKLRRREARQMDAIARVPDQTSRGPRTKADEALDAAQWTPVDWTGYRMPEDRPYATHTARIENAGRWWTCYTLDDGRRVIGRFEDFAVPGDMAADCMHAPTLGNDG